MQRLLRTEDLRAALREGRLESGTLVWKRGMKAWLPAGSVPELMDDFDTVTNERDGLDHTVTARRKQPSNMVDIASLRGPTPAREVHSTMIGGVGVDEPPKKSGRGPIDARNAAGLVIPPAPRLPSLSTRPPASTTVDGGWSAGAARRDEDEETVTRVRMEDDRRKKGSQRPPPPRRPQGPEPAPPPPPRSRRQLPRANTGASPAHRPPSIPAPPKAAPGQPRPALDSAEVLSSLFDRAGRPKDPQQNTHTLPSPTDHAPGAAGGHGLAGGEPAHRGRPREGPPTGPLPELRPGVPPGPAPPAFASEPWIPRAPATPRIGDDSQPIASQGSGPRQAFIPTDVPPRPGLPLRIDPRSPLLAGVAGGALLLLVFAFVVGRCSVSDSETVASARTGWASVLPFARASTDVFAAPRPCLMLRAPSRWEETASRSVVVELAARGDKALAVGFAASPSEPRGLVINTRSGVIESRYTPAPIDGTLSRVVPLPAATERRKDGGQGKDGAVSYGITTSERDGVRGASYVAMRGSFVVGFAGDKLVRSSEPGAKPKELWALTPDSRAGGGGTSDALRVVHVRGSAEGVGGGVAVTYRHAGRVWYGLLDEDGRTRHPAGEVAGSGGKVGKPAVASNGRLVSVVFADQPPGGGAVQIRWARGTLGKPLRKAEAVTLPPGGPGGDAIAPDIAALSGGRWLLLWTEGRSGQRALRAQTYDARFRLVGDALRVSPATGNFGQGVVGVAGESAAVAFLLATAEDYQLWGTVLQCQ